MLLEMMSDEGSRRPFTVSLVAGILLVSMPISTVITYYYYFSQGYALPPDYSLTRIFLFIGAFGLWRMKRWGLILENVAITAFALLNSMQESSRAMQAADNEMIHQSFADIFLIQGLPLVLLSLIFTVPFLGRMR